MYRLKAAAAAFALTAALAAPALTAEPTLTNPTRQIDYVTADNVTEIVRELGVPNVETVIEEGTTFVLFKSGEMPFHLSLRFCESASVKCVGLGMAVGFDPGDTRYSLEMFNGFNRANPFVSVVQLDGNKFAVLRMVVTEGGVTKKNIATNLSGFAGAPPAVMKYLNSQIIASKIPVGGQSPFQQVAGRNAGTLKVVPLTPAELNKVFKAAFWDVREQAQK